MKTQKNPPVAAAEVWKPVVGFEGYYEVSDAGRIRSVTRKCSNGTTWPGRVREPVAQGKYGHLAVMLYRDCRATKRYVHRAVLDAFIGPCPDGAEACHNDGDPTNNALTNLRWDTRKSNMADKRLHGTDQRGEQIPSAKLTEARVRELRSAQTSGVSYSKLCEQFGISLGAVHKIVRRITWAHVE